uniref:Methyltransferase domain-containing protein n=1 Tax=candidate division WOR-3 bacterium TaxID=2052148 RepID=A0A7V0Z819_UNCW3
MKNSREMLNYYRRIYEKGYKWFSYVYDPFVKLLFFVLNGGFGGERRWRELIIEWTNPQPGEKILDICCGTSTLAIMLGERLTGKGEVVGIELSSAQLKIAQKKQKPNNLTFIEADAQDIPFSDCYFDKGLICGTLHEMPQEVRQNVLSEAYRVIRAGGKIVIIEQNKPDRKWKAMLFDFMERFNPKYPTYRNLLKCGLTNEIERAGFKIIKTDTTSWEYFQIVLAGK